jgi:hypothetical protein
MKTLINNKWLWIAVIFATLIFTLANLYLTAFLSIVGGSFVAITMLQIFHFVDDKLLGDVDTKNELIEKGNVAYAIYMFSVALLIFGGFVFSALVFFTLK